MIEVSCSCGARDEASESQVGSVINCKRCTGSIHLVAGEKIPDGLGGGDFDANLQVLKGPARMGERLLLGGVAEIEIGKLADKPISLPGTMVSRLHCKMIRVDFGPSRWKIVDNCSTNGLYVNSQRVGEQELQHGDIVRIGEYEMQYGQAATVAVPAVKEQALVADVQKPASPKAAVQVKGEGPVCPSCQQQLAARASICVDCGIYIKTGRPLLTAKGLDEDELYVKTENWVRVISWVVGVTPLPIPVASEAFGTRKPYATWAIAAVTVLASILFLIVSLGSDDGTGKNLMLWAPRQAGYQLKMDSQQVRQVLKKMGEEEGRSFYVNRERLKGTVPDKDLDAAALTALVNEEIDATAGEFHWWQLFTHAFLHDTSSIFGFAMHLGGNLVFLLAFGQGVNAVLGNIKTVILYLGLAVLAAWGHIWSMGSNPPPIPMLGASGAIMGLAGMYLILFPVHKVHCAMWIRMGLAAGFRLGLKVFSIRGFWILLMYIGFDLLMSQLSSSNGSGVAHWAHIGGFAGGAVVALVLLISRQADSRGGDLLSVVFGKYAWGLIGKPSKRKKDFSVELVAKQSVSLNYQG